MTERTYRFILGSSLILFLLMQWQFALYALIAVLIFEAITNMRVPIMVSRMRYATDGMSFEDMENPNCRIDYEAERMFRWVVSFFILLGSILFADVLWFIPWFISLNLLLSGITGICPLVMILQRLGLK